MNRRSLLDEAPGLTERLVFFETVDSTNNAARQLAEQGLSRPVVIAAQQSAGRGRLSRAFLSPPDGLYLSMAFALPKDGFPPTVRAACGVCRALEELTGSAVSIKWVNDLLIREHKVAGILAEAAGGTVIAGIGVNVNTPAAFFEPELPNAASLASLFGKDFPIERCAALVTARMDEVWEEDSASILSYYRSRLITPGRRVEVVGHGQRRSGTAVGLDVDAALLVRFDGEETPSRVIFGDVSVRGENGYI